MALKSFTVKPGYFRTSTFDEEKLIVQKVACPGLNGTEIDVEFPPSLVEYVASVRISKFGFSIANWGMRCVHETNKQKLIADS